MLQDLEEGKGVEPLNLYAPIANLLLILGMFYA